MSTAQFHICLLTGFDRCGSSMIARALGQHPEINLLFQPFNGTEVSKTQWERWNKNETHAAPEKFIRELQQGKVEHDYIRSDWFRKYSSSQEVKPGLNLIKDTKLHFKLGWLRHHFPSIEVYGIWREPEEILHSLVKNNFHQSWYGYLTPEILNHAVAQFDRLSHYAAMIKENSEGYERMALGIAMRTEILLQSMPSSNWFVYEDVVAQPDFILNKFLARFNLPAFDFSNVMRHDYNVAGALPAERISWEAYFSPLQQKKIAAIFQRLNALAKPKSLTDA